VDAMEYKYSFEKLEVWNDARNLVKMIYLQTDNFPKEKDLDYLTPDMFTLIKAEIDKIANKANALKRSFIKQLND